MSDDIIFRLRERARIRRQIPGRKSVIEGKPDRIAELLEEAANEINSLNEALEFCIRMSSLKIVVVCFV